MLYHDFGNGASGMPDFEARAPRLAIWRKSPCRRAPTLKPLSIRQTPEASQTSMSPFLLP
eukprot:719655-Pleurochrysis_carterae.AAC.1